MKNKPTGDRVCLTCEVTFQPTGQSHRYCTSCRLERRKAQGREYHNNYPERQRKWQQDNPDKVLGAQYRHRFGIGLSDYETLLEIQDGRCWICKKTPDENTLQRRLAVDHNRTCCSGKRSCGNCIRGLLCQRCNQGVGLFDDDPDLFMRAASYLMEDWPSLVLQWRKN